MQGLADGYFVIPYTIGDHLARNSNAEHVPDNHPAVTDAVADVQTRLNSMLNVKGSRSVDSIHRELGQIMWNNVGMSRSGDGLSAAVEKIQTLRDVFWNDVRILGSGQALNQNLEHAGRVADFLEFAELMATDALHREESCGGHFREEHQTDDNEARRDDDNFCYVGAWEHSGVDEEPVLHREPLTFDEVPLTQRSYK